MNDTFTTHYLAEQAPPRAETAPYKPLRTPDYVADVSAPNDALCVQSTSAPVRGAQTLLDIIYNG